MDEGKNSVLSAHPIILHLTNPLLDAHSFPSLTTIARGWDRITKMVHTGSLGRTNKQQQQQQASKQAGGISEKSLIRCALGLSSNEWHPEMMRTCTAVNPKTGVAVKK